MVDLQKDFLPIGERLAHLRPEKLMKGVIV
jgi:hypothetical protein